MLTQGKLKYLDVNTNMENINDTTMLHKDNIKSKILL